LFIPADEDLLADMMAHAETRLEQAGFDHYEVSNWARVSQDFRYECRHNLQYWRNRPYYGFGAGAHGCLDGLRLANAVGIDEYIRLIMTGSNRPFPQSPATIDWTGVDENIAMQETMMLGLRLTRDGLSRRNFYQRFGREIGDVFGAEIDKLIGQGLLEWVNDGENLRLTERGRFLGNRVFMEFVGNT
jgi:oxygen-independent coproporphyrinogen-3 oxidase